MSSGRGCNSCAASVPASRPVSSPPRHASGCVASDTLRRFARRRSARFTEADDPKRLIGFDARLQEIVGQYLAGDLKGALARCRALLHERPDMPLTLFHLAHLERESGNLEGAIDALRKAVAIVPDNSETVAMLGGYLTQAGRAGEASRCSIGSRGVRTPTSRC